MSVKDCCLQLYLKLSVVKATAIYAQSVSFLSFQKFQKKLFIRKFITTLPAKIYCQRINHQEMVQYCSLNFLSAPQHNQSQKRNVKYRPCAFGLLQSFDTIDARLLRAKLTFISFNTTRTRFFYLYLSNRYQRMSCTFYTSYTFAFATVAKQCSVYAFADDAKLLLRFRKDRIHVANNHLNIDVKAFNDFSRNTQS